MSKKKIMREDIAIEITDGREYLSGEMRTNGPIFGVKVTHEPTGISFTELEGRSQFINKNAAIAKLEIELKEKGWSR